MFCCPPYAFFEDRQEDVLTAIENLIEAAPSESIFVVESDARFDQKKLPNPNKWKVRKYSPAIVAVYRKSDSKTEDDQTDSTEPDAL